MKTKRTLRLIALAIGGLQVMSRADPSQMPGATMGLGIYTSQKQIESARAYARNVQHRHGHADHDAGGPLGAPASVSQPIVWPLETRFGETFEGMVRSSTGFQMADEGEQGQHGPQGDRAEHDRRQRRQRAGAGDHPGQTDGTQGDGTPTPVPTHDATPVPTSAPTSLPTSPATATPSPSPTVLPTVLPTIAPTPAPTVQPTPSAPPTPGKRIDGKLLVVSADGTEPSLAAIKQTLDYLGTPYTVWVATQQPGALTADKLANADHGFYQGVILTSNSLGIQTGNAYVSALGSAEWTALAAYEASFGVRQVDWYTYPTAELGFGTATAVSTDTTPVTGSLTAAGQAVFASLNPTAKIAISKAYTYLAPASSPNTAALLSDASGNALVAVHTYPDGRETLAQTFDNNAFLVHSEALGYGLVNWVTRGLFLGERHVYAIPQVDDLFNDNDMFPPAQPVADPREHAIAGVGNVFRLNGADLTAFTRWQTAIRSQSVTAGYTTCLPFNGVGTTGAWLKDEGFQVPDDLMAAVGQVKDQYGWISHTYTHPYLDAISYNDCTSELVNNWLVADSQQLATLDRSGLITPNVSGLANANAMRAVYDQGVRYVVSDTSVAGQNNPTPNAGIVNALVPGILEVPRRPTNLFYNVSTPAEWVAEYNKLYATFWGHSVDYNELLDKESDVLLGYLLKGENDPWMFHQPNMRAYDGTHSLLGDLLDRAFAKYAALATMPVQSPSLSELGSREAKRMAYNQANVTATIVPGVSITLVAQSDATVPVTGLNAGSAEAYGGVPIAWLDLKAGQSVTLPLH